VAFEVGDFVDVVEVEEEEVWHIIPTIEHVLIYKI
jgi:hypothetical protein